MFFIVHGIQQNSERSSFTRIHYKILQELVKHARFIPIQIELDDRCLPDTSRFSRAIVIPHPLPSDLQRLKLKKTELSRKLTIGIVGMIRPDKPTSQIIASVQEFKNTSTRDIDIIFGSPRWQFNPDSLAAGIHYRDTTGDLYYALLQELDIVVCDFNSADFFYRPSGIVNDALAYNCVVVARNLPVISQQCTDPVKAGVLYDSDSQIHTSLNEAVELAFSKPNFNLWRSKRSDTLIVDLADSMNLALQSKARTVPDNSVNVGVARVLGFEMPCERP